MYKHNAEYKVHLPGAVPGIPLCGQHGARFLSKTDANCPKCATALVMLNAPKPSPQALEASLAVKAEINRLSRIIRSCDADEILTAARLIEQSR